jgi:hypothetical protein
MVNAQSAPGTMMSRRATPQNATTEPTDMFFPLDQSDLESAARSFDRAFDGSLGYRVLIETSELTAKRPMMFHNPGHRHVSAPA